MPDLRQLLKRRSYLFALVLALILLIVNVIAMPSFLSPSNIPGDLGLLAPMALVAMASTPAVLSGNGGLDISIGPLMNFTNIILVLEFMPHGLGAPEVAIPLILLVGAAIGAINGVMVAVLRYQPMIATLCTFFVLGGANIALAPNPQQAPHSFTDSLANSVGPIPGAIITIGAVFVVWWLLQRTSYVRNLMSVGASDASAYSAGVNVTAVRIIAFTLGGLFAAVAGIALTGLVQSGDPNYGTQYALLGFAGVALGGTPIGGGRGGLFGSFLGAVVIYLIHNLLLDLHVSVVWLEVAYGALLIGSVAISASVIGRPQLRAA